MQSADLARCAYSGTTALLWMMKLRRFFFPQFSAVWIHIEQVIRCRCCRRPLQQFSQAFIQHSLNEILHRELNLAQDCIINDHSKVIMYFSSGNSEGGLLPEFVVEKHQHIFQYLVGLVGHLNIINRPGDSTLFTTHHLVDDTPIILISHETMLLSQEDGQFLPKQKCRLEYPIEGLVELCIEYGLSSFVRYVWLVCWLNLDEELYQVPIELEKQLFIDVSLHESPWYVTHHYLSILFCIYHA